MTSRWRRQAGYTLVETIVAVAVGAIVMAAVFPIFLLLYRVETSWGANTQARAAGLLAEDSLMRDLRAYQVKSVDPLILTVPGDVSVSIRYTVDGGRLTRSVAGNTSSTVTVAHGISQLSVFCSGDPATFRLVITTAGLSGPNVPLQPDFFVSPRNPQRCP